MKDIRTSFALLVTGDCVSSCMRDLIGKTVKLVHKYNHLVHLKGGQHYQIAGNSQFQYTIIIEISIIG